jgi:hypothetical protein
MGMSMGASITVVFLDSERISDAKPDPQWPNGKPVNLAEGVCMIETCTRNLPHPAPRCGSYFITCETCGFTGVIVVHGLADDPNMITMPCRRKSGKKAHGEI